MKVQVSVIIPPQIPGAAVCVDVTEPLIKQVPVPPLVYDNELTAGMLPQATVIFPGEEVKPATGGGVTVTITLHVLGQPSLVIWSVKV